MRKALILGVAACGLLFAMPVSAEECSNAVQLINRNQQSPAPTAANTANPMVLCPADMDTDKNGVVSAEEWTAATSGWFTSLDEDKSGDVSVDEINRLQGRY